MRETILNGEVLRRFLFSESLDIYPKQLAIPADEIGQYSIRLNCILTDHHRGHRHHEIYWWHNNRRLGSQTNRYARIVRNVTQHSFISTLLYTGEPANIVGHYICESDPLRRSVLVKLETSRSKSLFSTSISQSVLQCIWISWIVSSSICL